MLQKPRGTAEIRKNLGRFVLKCVVHYVIKCLHYDVCLYERKLYYLNRGINFAFKYRVPNLMKCPHYNLYLYKRKFNYLFRGINYFPVSP